MYLLEHVIPKHRKDIELLVVNNCSTDSTVSLLTPLVSKGVKLINREKHLPSAEANMFASVELCQGRYIWFHGDDDIPLPQNVEWLLKSLEIDDVDMFITNSISIDINGSTIVERLLKMNSPHIDVSGGGIVFACGFLNVLAGISGIIFRRSKADVKIAQEIADIQEIYAHVAWLIHCFSGTRVRILDQPLVYYRTDDPKKTAKHFKKYAQKKGIGDHYIWSFGLIKLLNYLLTSGALTAEEIGRIYDGRRDGSKFRLIDQIIHSIYLQIRDGIKDKSLRNKVSNVNMQEAMDLLYKVDLFSFDAMFILNELVGIQNRNARWRGFLIFNNKIRILGKSFEKVFAAQHADNFYRSITVGRFMNYQIYTTPVGYVALSDKVKGQRESILSYIDPIEEYPDIITGKDLESIRNVIIGIVEWQRAMMREDSGYSATPIKQVSIAMRRISEEMQLAANAGRVLAELRVQEIEISRQSTYLFRLLTYKVLFAPFRRGWLLLRGKSVR